MPHQEPKPRKLKLVKSSYQPTKAELQETIKLDACFEDLVQAMVQPVDIEWTDKPKRD